MKAFTTTDIGVQNGLDICLDGDGTMSLGGWGMGMDRTRVLSSILDNPANEIKSTGRNRAALHVGCHKDESGSVQIVPSPVGSADTDVCALVLMRLTGSFSPGAFIAACEADATSTLRVDLNGVELLDSNRKLFSNAQNGIYLLRMRPGESVDISTGLFKPRSAFGRFFLGERPTTPVEKRRLSYDGKSVVMSPSQSVSKIGKKVEESTRAFWRFAKSLPVQAAAS